MALINELRDQGNYLFKYRGFLPVLIIVPALAVFVFRESEGSAINEWEETVRYIALGVSFIGILIRAHVIGHVAPNTSGRNTDEGQIADVINTTGWYSVVRHPLYVGNFFMWLGPALWTMNFWFICFFIVLYYLYYERIMYAEERFLQDKFGDKYMSWAAGRPAFVPKFSQYSKATTPFNWRKVLRQERTGFLATFFMFWLFDVTGAIVKHGFDSLHWNFWNVALIIALIIFLILKSMKRSAFLKDR